MKHEREPVRSLDDASSPEALRVTLAAHAADRPSPERLARMSKGLEQALGMPLAAARVPLRGGLPVRRLLSWVGVGAAVIAGGALWLARPRPAPVVQPAPAPLQAAPEIPAPVQPKAAPAPEPQPAPQSPRSAPAPKRRSSDPAAELELLRRAQQQLTAAPARALVLAEEHAGRYPDGVFRQERELIAIVALLRRGNLPDAERRAARFRRTFRDSVHLSRLTELLRLNNNDPLPAPMSDQEKKSW